MITELAVGRLEDKIQKVRKNAMKLLQELIQYNPYFPHLSYKALKGNRKQVKKLLQVMKKL